MRPSARKLLVIGLWVTERSDSVPVLEHCTIHFWLRGHLADRDQELADVLHELYETCHRYLHAIKKAKKLIRRRTVLLDGSLFILHLEYFFGKRDADFWLAENFYRRESQPQRSGLRSRMKRYRNPMWAVTIHYGSQCGLASSRLQPSRCSL